MFKWYGRELSGAGAESGPGDRGLGLDKGDAMGPDGRNSLTMGGEFFNLFNRNQLGEPEWRKRLFQALSAMEEMAAALASLGRYSPSEFVD